MGHGWLQHFALRGNTVPELLGMDHALPSCLDMVFAPSLFPYQMHPEGLWAQSGAPPAAPEWPGPGGHSPDPHLHRVQLLAELPDQTPKICSLASKLLLQVDPGAPGSPERDATARDPAPAVQRGCPPERPWGEDRAQKIALCGSEHPSSGPSPSRTTSPSQTPRGTSFCSHRKTESQLWLFGTAEPSGAGGGGPWGQVG